MASVGYLIAALAWLFGINTALGHRGAGSCEVDQARRVECGWPGISHVDCRSRGCCYDNTRDDGFWCYQEKHGAAGRGAPAVDEPEKGLELPSRRQKMSDDGRQVVKTCNTMPRNRLECGWSSISERDCVAMGCCYDNKENYAPWCFQQDWLLVDARSQDVLECVWQCSRKSWRDVAQAYARCSTNTPCWRTVCGDAGAVCLDTCKTQQGILDMLVNVSECVGLSSVSADRLIDDCSTDVPCWIARHGVRALLCFRKQASKGKTAKQPAATSGAEESEQTGKHPKQPNIAVDRAVQTSYIAPPVERPERERDPGKRLVHVGKMQRTPVAIEAAMLLGASRQRLAVKQEPAQRLRKSAL